MWIVKFAAFVQTVSEVIYQWANRIRRQYLIPCFFGSRDMILLHNGCWMDGLIRAPKYEIRCIYDAEKHTVFLVDEDGSRITRTVRWPWLSVVTRDGADISEFFSSLRISAGLQLMQLDVLMLYAHQTGILHLRGLEVMGRDGSVIVV
jgi:hypothetical protein